MADDTGLRLQASVRGAPGPLLPEQNATFDLVLQNPAPNPAPVLALDGNQWTPRVRAYHPDGEVLIDGTPVSAEVQMGVEMGEPVPIEPTLVELPAGGELQSWVNLWSHGPPLDPGRYDFEAIHQIRPDGGEVVTSNRVPFEVVPARVLAHALGYDSVTRNSSVLAWLAAPADGRPPILLMRLSGFETHTGNHFPGTSHGPFAASARLAVGHQAPGVPANWTGWAAVVEGEAVHLIRHNMGNPMSRRGPVPLPIQSPRPVPRFPDRGYAVFLATGTGPGGPALAGLIARDDDEAPPAVWTVPLSAVPDRTACAFGLTGALALLLVSPAGPLTRVSRLDVYEAGAVVGPERVVHTTPHVVLAVAVDSRPGAMPSFLVLEADRARPDRLAVVRVPVLGDALIPAAWGPIPGSAVWIPGVAPEPPGDPRRPPPPRRPESQAPVTAAMPGWPADAQGRPVRAAEVALEVDPAGAAWLAITDDRGRLHGGRLDTGLELLRDEPGSRSIHPHVAAFARAGFVACFTAEGSLFHTSGHDHSH